MIFLVFIFIILIVLVIIIAFAWRIASRRYTLPCPVWMKWLLDPPSDFFDGKFTLADVIPNR